MFAIRNPRRMLVRVPCPLAYIRRSMISRVSVREFRSAFFQYIVCHINVYLDATIFSSISSRILSRARNTQRTSYAKIASRNIAGV